MTTGVIVEDRYLRANRLHRDPSEGPALIHRHPSSGAVFREFYSVKGKYHRDAGPAIIEWDLETGIVTQEDYYQNGKPHRVGGPSRVSRDGVTGEVTAIWFDVLGVRHRDPAEGPSHFQRNLKTGVTTHETYETNGKLHRLNGPAWIRRAEGTGIAIDERYYVNGKFHRSATEGPAVIGRHGLTGEITKAEYWENDERVPPPRRGSGNHPAKLGDPDPA